MKRLLLGLSLLLLAAASSFGQEVKYGLKAGVNFAKQTASAEGVTYTSSSLTSFHIEGYGDFGLSQTFSLQAGVGLSGKGVKDDGKAELMYIEVPVNAVAKFPVASFGKLFLGAGPYAGIKVSEKFTQDNISVSPDESFYKRADFGVNFLGGMEFNGGLTLNAGYGLGLINVLKDADGTSVKNKVFKISLGYLF